MANRRAGDYLIAVNDAGDYPLRYDGTTWTTLNAGQIHYDRHAGDRRSRPGTT